MHPLARCRASEAESSAESGRPGTAEAGHACWGEPRRDCVSCSHSRLEVPRQGQVGYKVSVRDEWLAILGLWGTPGSQRHTAIPDKDSHCGRARYPYCCTRAQCARYPDTGVRPPRTAILRERRHNTAIPPTYKCRSMAKYAYFNTTQTSPPLLQILQIRVGADCAIQQRVRHPTASVEQLPKAEYALPEALASSDAKLDGQSG